ncbi:heavy-metal-associated domain-containing protein [Catelliglobosispora koreensis]|uniref:heavy-metal-associated domain-containing protein n=1 Tax=Catelliglobosispora koreensis TaxID=129052 RepID=UPI00036C8268|nr:cation transporter [Catelliglobosispora koreensis]
MTTYLFTVTGMHCASCGMLIDETLEDDIDGVTRSETSVRKGQTTVTAAEHVQVDTIVAAIAQVGYQARLEATS